jgi:hypothetical protein
MDAEFAGYLATRASYFRGPVVSADPEGNAPFKEWLHFCVLAPDVRLLVNMSLVARPGKNGNPSNVDARVIVLAEVDGEWTGGLDEIQPVDLEFVPGRVDSRFGGTSLRVRLAAFELALEPKGVPLSARLRLEPTTIPLLRPKTVLGSAVVSWLATPRLRASGSIMVKGRPHFLIDAPAYHDHNWGHWRWGREFFWQWAFGAPSSRDDQWTAVFYRMFDRSRTVEHARALLLWRDQNLFRVFRDDEIEVHEGGFLRAQKILKIPPVMGLLAPQLSTDVAARLSVEARSAGDVVQLTVDNRDLAQVIVPNDVDLGSTIINEVVGTFALSGDVQNIAVGSRGQSFYEHVTRG